MDRITKLFRTLREEEGAEDEKALAPPRDDAAQDFQFAKSARVTGGASELVVEENPALPDMEELQRELRCSTILGAGLKCDICYSCA